MKLALAVHQFYPEHQTGTEVLAYRTARQLRAIGHEVTIFTGHPLDYALELPADKLMDEYHFDGFPVCRFLFSPITLTENGHIMRREYCNGQFDELFENQLSQRKIELVHFFHFLRLGMSVIDACRRQGIPTVFTPTDFFPTCHKYKLILDDGANCNGPEPDARNCIKHFIESASGQPGKDAVGKFSDEQWQHLIGRIRSGKFDESARQLPCDSSELKGLVDAAAERIDYVRQQLKKLDKIITPTQLVGDPIKALLGDASKFHDLSFGIDTEGAIVRQRQLKAPLKVGFIGHFIPAKGVHTLITAMRHIPAAVPLELAIYGDGHSDEYKQKLLALAKGDSRISFRGVFQNNEIWQVMDSLDVLAIPSTWHENTPLVLLSAQAAHCPVVATNMDGITSVIKHGVNGLIFDKENDEQLAQHLIRLATDSALLPALSSNASPVASIEEYVDDLVSVYKQVLPSACHA